MMNAQDRLRYAGTDWDKPEVRVKLKGDRDTVSRKVLTIGVKTIDSGDLMKDVLKYLRQGYEVQLGTSDAWLRLYPCVTADCTKMFVSAQTMGNFRNKLNDKHFELVHRGETIDAETANARGVENHRKNKRESAEITPDTMATCPKCGFTFRIGRKIGD